MPNPVVQFQILAPNPERAAKFYADTFGWRVDAANGLGYRQLHTLSKQGIAGGVWPAPEGAPGMVQLFIQVDDVAASAAKATAQGARVLIPPQTLPDGDEMAVLLDPEGISFGLMKTARTAVAAGG